MNPSSIEKYILPVRHDLRREISKRGTVSHRKGQDGTVEKKRNSNGTSSLFGWGAVDDTLPLIKKDLDFVRKNMDLIMAQIKLPGSYLEREPVVLTTKKRPPTVDLTPTPGEKRIKTAEMIELWYADCAKHFESGAIGLIPDCWHESLPPLEQVLSTSMGNVLIHFCRFVKGKF